MNPFLALLGQQAAPEAAQGQIDVVARRGSPQSHEGGSPYEDYALNNVPAVRARSADVKETEEASDRKGMFGVKGTLRDILGLVGDAFLVQSGNKPVYAPQRQQERISDALAGFTEDPVAASERVANYDAAAGVDLYDRYRTNEAKDASARSLEATRTSQIEKRDADLIADGRKVAQAVLAQSGAYDANGNISPAALSVLDRIAKQSNATREDLIGESMTGEEARLYGGAGINPYQQAQLPLAERRVATGERNAATAEGRLKVSQQQANTAAKALGLREGSEQWNQYMDLLDVSLETDKEQNRRKGTGPKSPRTVPKTSRFRPASN